MSDAPQGLVRYPDGWRSKAILLAWHERQVSAHLEQLAAIGKRPGRAADRLQSVLDAFALIMHERDRSDLAALLHRNEHVAHAEHRLHGFVRDLVTEGVEAGNLRTDVSPDELATYCVHALGAARVLPSRAAIQRLVGVTLAGLRQAAVAKGRAGR